MLGIKVKLIDAEKIKNSLIKKGIYDYEKKLLKDSGHIIFPVTKKTRITNTTIVDIEFEPMQKKQSYKDLIAADIKKENLPSSYDLIGNIAIIEDKGTLNKKIGDALIESNKAITTVLSKSGIHEGEFRTQKLSFVSGKKTKEALHKENGVTLKLDVEKVYFSPRLSTERKRIFRKVNPGEKILVMFSGCGVYPIVIGKNTSAKRITGIELNPIAHKYAEENVKLNHLEKKIDLIEGDVKNIIPHLNTIYDRILMPLPKDADEFLYLIPKIISNNTIIHLYQFYHINDFHFGEEKIEMFCKKHKLKYKIINFVKCGQYSPNKYRVCIDFLVSN